MEIMPAVAKTANANSCTACHVVGKALNQACAECHQTEAFHSDISDKHVKAGLTCIQCHDEHQGANFRPASTANDRCMACHKEGVISNGITLKTPHGGTLGYPIFNGKWEGWGGVKDDEWKRKGFDGKSSDHGLKEQFHLIHVGGRREGRSNCSDCHKVGFEPNNFADGVKDSCAECHALNYQAATKKPESVAGCVGCHTQHGEEKELRSALRRDPIIAATNSSGNGGN